MGGPVPPRRGLSDLFGNPLGGLGGLSGLGQAQQNLHNHQLDALRYQQQAQHTQARFEMEMHERALRLQTDPEVLKALAGAKLPPKPEDPPKPRHSVNYAAELLPELRKWRDNWLKM